MSVLFAMKDLRVTFATPDGAVPAVAGVDLSVSAGETVGIVGESGSGKSQAMLASLGLADGNARVDGSVTLAGRELIGMSERELNRVRGLRIGMIFQDPMTSLNPYRKISAQMTEVLSHHQRLGRAAARRRAIEMLEAVRIPDAATRFDRYPHEFSGGMRQRVMIAMALLCEPALLIADEPTTALDVTVQAQILELLRDLQSRLGTAVLFITHDLGVVAEICDRVIVMYAGAVVETAPVAGLFQAPRHPYTQALLRSVPRRDERDGRPRPIPGQPPDPLDKPAGCPFHPRCEHRFEPCTSLRPDLRPVDADHAVACHLVHREDGT